MKKIIKSIICCLLCIALSGVLAFAEGETPTMDMSWHTDYTGATNKLIVQFKSHVDYYQVVSVVMYPEGTLPNFSNYKRIWEDTLNPGEERTVEFIITDELDKADGKYVVRIQGSGYRSKDSYEAQTVEIKNPTDESKLIDKINNSVSTDDAASLLEEVENALQITLEEEDALVQRKAEAFISIRNADYEGEFDNLNEVRDAYKKADVIDCLLYEADPLSKGLVDKVAACADIMDFDVADEDYKEYMPEIYKEVIAHKNNYNGERILNTKLLKEAIVEYRVVEVINDSDQETLLSKIPVYYDDFGADSSYSIYSDFSLPSQGKVARMICVKDKEPSIEYTSASEIKTAFDNAVAAVKAELDGLTGSGGGGGGGGGGSTTLDPGTLGGETVVTPMPAGKFKDCDKNHWAYSYISELSKEGVISGYTDGTFLPEKKVNREEFVKMIIAGTGLYSANAEVNFTDVPKTSWFYSYVASAKESGIVSGITENSFGAGGMMTRQDVAVIISRVLDKFNVEVPSSSAMKVFKDEESMSDYAKDSIETLVRLGIIDGFADETFRPKDALTRAQAAKIIYLVRELI